MNSIGNRFSEEGEVVSSSVLLRMGTVSSLQDGMNSIIVLYGSRGCSNRVVQVYRSATAVE